MAKRPNQPPEGNSRGYDSSIHEFLSQLRRELDLLEQELTDRENRLAQAERELEENKARFQQEQTGWAAQQSRERDHLEKDLSEWKSRLAQAERDLKTDRARLQQEQTTWAAQQGRERDLAVGLTDANKKLAEREALLKDREEQLRVFATRNQELRDQAAELTRLRNEAEARFKEAREQADIQSRRAAGLEKQVEVLKKTPPPASAPAKASPGTAARPVRTAAGAAVAAERANKVSEKPTLSPLLIGLAIASVFISAGLGVWAYASYEPTYLVSAQVKTRPGDETTLLACQEQAMSNGLLVANPDVPRGLLTFWLQSRNSAGAAAQINDIGNRMVAMFRGTSTSPATQPGSSPQRDHVLERIARIEQQLGATSRPAAATDDEGARLVALWMAAENQRREVDSSLASLSDLQTGSPPDAASIQIDPSEVQAVEQADTMLQSEIEALEQREAELADTLKRITSESDAAFKSLNQAIADGTGRIARATKEDYGTRIRDSLQVLNASLSAWKTASGAMSSDWTVQHDAMAGGADPLTCQAQLEQAARHFIDTGSASLVQFRQRLEGIAQDTDEPTKGLVLSRALTKDLQPVVDAQQEVVRLARSATLSGNVELATTVQRVASLRRQIADKRTRIEAELRAKIIENLQKNRQQTVKERREQLTRRAEELDREIRGHIENVRAFVRQTGHHQSDLSEWGRLQDERASALRELAEIERQSPAAAAVAEPVYLEFDPARIELGESPDRRVIRSLLIGFGSLFACLIGWLMFHSYQSWHQGRREIEAYTRELQNAAKK